MVKKEFHIIKSIVALFLGLLLLSPLVLRSIHQHENNVELHKQCGEDSAHFHQDHAHCDVCHFTFSSFDFQVKSNDRYNKHFFEKTVSISYTSLKDTRQVNFKKLRGPPLAI